jgi:hypothetical protein
VEFGSFIARSTWTRILLGFAGIKQCRSKPGDRVRSSRIIEFC